MINTDQTLLTLLMDILLRDHDLMADSCCFFGAQILNAIQILSGIFFSLKDSHWWVQIRKLQILVSL